MRVEYTRAGLDVSDVQSSPFEQFAIWFDQACEAALIEPNAMSLATADDKGRPSVRTVLLKYFDGEGFVFFTNYESKKARQIAQNPNAALLFPWIGLERQVIIEGNVEKVSAAESLKYFLKRPLGSQLGAWVSRQSSVVSSRQMLEMEFEKMKRKFADGKVPLPDFWGGYRVVPREFEFWQGRSNRLHDRIRYRRDSQAGWIIERLSP
jgi:pyridoxamine 5'-phosphate oxidase